MFETPRPTVSIIIKALNEERGIAAAIESVLAADQRAKAAQRVAALFNNSDRKRVR